jgi:uncharacterized protein (DUF1697 family)
MPVYIALLRGINIGPHKRMKMEKLRGSCEALGFAEVKTYIQSGNIVFRTGILRREALTKKLEEGIVRDFGFSSDIIIRSKEELDEIVAGNPLLRERGVDESKLHVVFVRKAPSPAAIRKLESLTLEPDKIRHAGQEIYFYFPNGVSGSSLWKHPLDRILEVPGTMRNWRTVITLSGMAAECA